MSVIDETHDARRESWVASARDHAEFPIQNLPLGVFSPAGGPPRGGVAIGDAIFDLPAGLEAGLFSGEAARGAEASAFGCADSPAERPAQDPERGGAELRSMPQARLRTGARRLGRARQRARRADPDRRGREPPIRARSLQ